MRKIIAMVGISILVFLAVTVFSVAKSLEGTRHLAEVRDLYFPVLQKIDSNSVRLDKMEDLFLVAAMTGERDSIRDATVIFQAGDRAFAEMSGIYPTQSAEIARLRAEFKGYHDFAAATAEKLVSSHGGDIQVQAKSMKTMLDALRGSISKFRTESYDNFVLTLAESQRTVTLNLYMGIALGSMNLCFMGVLVFFIRNNVRMMGVIAEQNATLEKRVEERTVALRKKTADIQAMLQNMPQGVLTVLPGGTIHPEYSAYLEKIFCTHEIAGRQLSDLVLTNTSLGANTLDQIVNTVASCIGEDEMNFEFNAHLLATEFDKTMSDGARKSLDLSWSPICDDTGTIEKLMVCVRDVTELKRLVSEASSQKRELAMIGEILAVTQEKFQEFMQSSVAFVDENRALTAQVTVPTTEVITQLFRNMHTVKGNARTYGLDNLTNTVHEAEQAYDELRKGELTSWDTAALLAQVDVVRGRLDEYAYINDHKLGRKGPGRRGDVERFLMVEKDQVQQALAGMQTIDLDNAQATRAALIEARKVLLRMGTQNLREVLSGVIDSLPSLAKELSKEPPTVRIQDNGITICNQANGLLKNLCTHLLRNAMDHGIESTDGRMAAGKPVVGTIGFDLALSADQLTLALRDDGQGMALHRIRRTAVERGMVEANATLDDEQTAKLIFLPGFSTAEAVTEVSGRGVGMDAAKGFLEQEGGAISVRFTGAETGSGHRPFEFLITLPARFAVGEITAKVTAPHIAGQSVREEVLT